MIKSEKTEDMIVGFANQLDYDLGKLDSFFSIYPEYRIYSIETILDTKQIYFVLNKMRINSSFRSVDSYFKD